MSSLPTPRLRITPTQPAQTSVAQGRVAQTCRLPRQQVDAPAKADKSALCPNPRIRTRLQTPPPRPGPEDTTTSRGCPGAVRRYVDTPMPRTDLKAHPVIAGGLSVAITSPSAATAGIPLPALAVCSLAMNVAIPIVGPSAKQTGEPSEIDAPRDARLRNDVSTSERAS